MPSIVNAIFELSLQACSIQFLLPPNFLIINSMELKAKQDYLFTEILQANYDPEVFQEYMERQRGVDLEAYSLEELMSVVQQFKGIGKDEKQPEQMHQQVSAKSGSPSILTGDFKQELMQKDNMMEKELKKSDSFNTSTKVFHQFIRKQDLPQLYRRVHQQRENIRVKIRSYSKETDQSFLGGTYIAYLLETGAWDVRRRFKDFEWLHSRLSLMYPGLPIPPIPRKTTLRSFEDRHLEQRMVFFERFVNRLLQIPELCSDPVLEDFLSVAGQQEWTTCRERFEIRLSNQGSKITSLKGEGIINTAQFAIDPKQTQSLAKSLELTRTLNSLLSSFQKALRTATERAFELAATLGEAYRELQREGARGSQVVELMGQFVSELGYRLDSECFFVKGNLEDYWAYQQKYQQNLLTAIAKNSKDNLELVTKAKSLNHHQPELEDAPKSRSLAEYLTAKEQYRIRLSFTLEQLRRHRDEDLKVVGRDWASALGQYVGGIKDLMLSGADQMTKALCVSEGKQLREVEYLGRQRNKESVLHPKEGDH